MQLYNVLMNYRKSFFEEITDNLERLEMSENDVTIYGKDFKGITKPISEWITDPNNLSVARIAIQKVALSAYGKNLYDYLNAKGFMKTQQENRDAHAEILNNTAYAGSAKDQKINAQNNADASAQYQGSFSEADKNALTAFITKSSPAIIVIMLKYIFGVDDGNKNDIIAKGNTIAAAMPSPDGDISK